MILFANNAATTLASAITASDTSITVATGTGALFPTITGVDYFYCTLQSTNGAPREIVKVTATVGDTFTVVRGQDGTTASAFSQFDYFELRVVAEDMRHIVPSGAIMMWSGNIASIPLGWLLCDGTNGTPDLRNKFIVGAYHDTTGTAYTTITGSDTQTGGTKDAIVVTHTHTATVSDPGHHHTVYADPGGSGGAFGGGTSGTTTNINSSTNTTGVSVGISTDGSSGTNQNLPPYYALAYIQKT